MDFLALPRRDLQALCKRNGVRANMTNAAMADALRALPKVDGIEEYVKQPVPVPETEVKAAVEEPNTGKQGSPLTRGRRVVTKSSEPIEPEEDDEEKKENAKRQYKKEDVQALGVGRRGASRRARPVPEPAAVAEEESQGEEEDLTREAKSDKAPSPVVGRRGASRRARPVPEPAAVAVEESQGEEEDLTREAKSDKAPSPVVGRRARPSRAVSAPTAESEVTGAEEEQREKDVVEDLKREATMDDAPALGVGRRGASRRARPAPSVAALADKVVEERQRAPIPRGRRVKAVGSSTEPIRLDGSDDEEKEDAKPEEQQEDAQILGVGRRGGANRRAQAAPAVAAPEAKAEEEQRAPVLRDRVKAKSTEPTRLDDIKEEKKVDTKLEEEKGDAPAIAVRRCGASRRAPAPSEAPATRRSAAASKAQAGDVAVAPSEAPTTRRSAAASKAEVGDVAVADVPIRATRQRKPTTKAAASAAAEEKGPRRATRWCAVMSTEGTLLQPEVEEEPQEAVGAPDVAVEAVPIRATRQRKPTMKAAAAPAATEEEKAPPRAMRRGSVMRTILQPEVLEELQGVFSDAEVVGASVSYQRCDALEEVSDPQKEELNEDEDEDGDVVINEDEKLMEKSSAEEPSVTNKKCMDKSEMQEPQVADEKCHAPLASQVESLNHGLVSTVTEQAYEDDESANFQDGGGSNLGLLDKGVCECEETYGAGEEMELVLGVPALQASMAVNESDGNHESEIGSFRDETSEVDTKDEEACKEKEYMDIAELQSDTVDEAASLDCSGNISQVAEEETKEVSTEDGLSCQEEGDVAVDKVLHESVDKTILLDCSSDISWFEVEKAGNITSEMNENRAALDDDGERPNGMVIGDSMSQVTVAVEVIQKENGVLSTDEMPQGTAGMHDGVEDNQFETVFVQADQVVTADMEVNTEDSLSCQEEGIVAADMEGNVAVDKVLHDLVDNTILPDCSSDVSSVEVEKAGNITSEMPVNQAALDEDGDKPNGMAVGDSMSQATVTDEVIQKEMGVLSTDGIPQGTAGMHDGLKDNQFQTVFVQADQIVTTDNLSEQVTDSEITVELNTSLIVDERQQSTFTMDEDVVEGHTAIDGVHSNEQIQVVTTDKVPELKLIEDVLVQADQVVAAESLPEQVTDCEITVEGDTTLIVDEKKQSTVTMDGDVVFVHLKTDIAHTDEQKEMTGVVTKVANEITGTDDEAVEERAVVITEDIPNQGAVPSITHTMDGCVKENHFGTDFGHGNEQKKAVTADIVPEVSRTPVADPWKESAFLDGVTESNGIITMEPSVSVTEDILVCKNSSEKKTTEPMAVLEEKGVKVTKKSVDLSTLSLGQLRAKLKEKLNAKKNKEAKRVALARVDENVCRSHAKEQQQNLNQQQH